MAQEWLQQPLTVLVTDCFELFGLGVARILQTSGNKRSLELDSDYSESKFENCNFYLETIFAEIDQSNGKTEEGKFMQTFLDELHSYTSNFLPEAKYIQIDLINLHPDYQK